MATVFVKVQDRGFWVQAAVVEDAARDVLLGKDCPEQFALFAEVVEMKKRESNPAAVTVVTRSQARSQAHAELTEPEKDHEADMCELGREFDLDSSLFHPGTKVRKSKRQKQKENMLAFVSCLKIVRRK